MHSSHCIDSEGAIPLQLRKKHSGLAAKMATIATTLMLLQCFTSTMVAVRAAPGEMNTDADLGKIVTDPPALGTEAASDGAVAGTVDPNYVPVLPFTEAQEQRKAQLEQIYKNDEIGLAIDSIEPEAGPITGETRVLVRGGPFEDMTLLYPRPKCKFGANDRIVEATYVKCHEKPLTMEDLEGKSKDKVSIKDGVI